MTFLELLAPARNADIGIAAIRCGADAVYIGGPAFGARAAAGNSVEDIERLCREAAVFGVRIFVTVNTLARDDGEREEIVELLCRLKDKGVYAFILQDCTLLPLIRRKGAWKEEFHASTQCAARTPERALELSLMGFSRIVLERQLSLEQIKAIRSAIPENVEIECFIHGALCVCYSGDCYLSEYLTGRSANRGECAQPCRNTFDLVDKKGQVLVENRPLLSMKDLKLMGRIRDLAEAGVTSFKIEGRLKNASYVRNVTRACSLALDSFIASKDGKYSRASFGRVSGGFTPNPDKTFNRGYTSLFIDGKRGKWNSGEAAKGMGELVGTVSMVSDGHTGFIELKGLGKDRPAIHNGDGLCCISPSGEVAGFRADRVEGRRIWCKRVEGLEQGCRIWRNLDTAFEKELCNNMPTRLIGIGLEVTVTGTSVNIAARMENGISFSHIHHLEGPIIPADNQDRMRGMIEGGLGKSSGNYSFKVDCLEAEGQLPLIPSSILNGIRRDLAQKAAETSAVARSQCLHTVPEGIETSVLEHPCHKGELMRSKYCILSELDKCLQTSQGRAFAKNGLLLKNNNRLIPLHFDCRNCEMILCGKK